MMDGINSKSNVAVIAATNYPWNLDGAILRRFDTQILIDLPSPFDIAELLNIEMKKMIKFKELKDKNIFCNSELEKQNKLTDVTNKTNNSSLICDTSCVEEPPTDLTTTKPYNQLIFDYFQDIKNKGGFVDGLIDKLYTEKFSNSDIARLLKASATYTGQLCIAANLFYSVQLLGDYSGTEYFISCITEMKNQDTFIIKSLEVLAGFVKPESFKIPPQIYQINKPQIVSINYAEEQYVNLKCFLYKNNDLVIDDPNLKDVYIKYDINELNPLYYKTQVLDDTPKDIIMSFNIIVKEDKNEYDVDTIYPISRELINNVFKPINESFQFVRNRITP
jgi:hypothetical protein